jgi:hypothetical protein
MPVIAIFIAVYKKMGFNGWIRTLSIGVILAIFIMFIPLSEDNGKIDDFFLNFVTALQSGSLDASYNDFLSKVDYIFNENPQSTFFAVYRTTMSVLMVLSPILFGGIILSLFIKLVQRLKYFFLYPFKDGYFFSELNLHSLALADSIAKNVRRPMIIFYNVLPEGNLYETALDNRYIVLEKNNARFNYSQRRSLYFFEIAMDTSTNLYGAQQRVQQLSRYRKRPKAQIYVFTDYPEAEIVLDATDKKDFTVTLVNRRITTAYELLFNQPLFNAFKPDGDPICSVLVAGAGATGMEVVKAAAWCGQMDGIPLEINIIDKNAGLARETFAMECPELADGRYSIHFHETDTRTPRFEDILNQYGRSANYIVVSLGDDDLNIKTALFLRGYFIRTDPDYTREPIICVQASAEDTARSLRELTTINRERLKTNNLETSSPKAQNYHFFPFGTYENVYSYETVIGSPIEKLARNVHAAYETAQNPDVSVKTINKNYNTNEIGKRSSRASAVHIRYKLHHLGYSMELAKPGEVCDPEVLAELREKLNDEAILSRFMKLEHTRWNVFQRSQGYRGVSIAQAQAYKAYTNGSHIHRRAKLHACICDWDELPKVMDTFDPNMLKYDRTLVVNIPAIIGAEKDDAINISGVRYMVKRLTDGN